MKFLTKNVLQISGTDKVYIPREVMCRENISDNTKLVFGIVFSECLNKMNAINIKTVSQAVNVLKRFGSDITLNTIEQECFCGTETAKVIKKELSSLIATLDIADCFYQCELHYANVPKPICLMCDGGKSVYKMIDMLNTLVDRTLNKSHIEDIISEDELQTLKDYNESHSPELINTVIDILKR